MRLRRLPVALLLALGVLLGGGGCSTPPPPTAEPAAAVEVEWRAWSDEAFAEAGRTDRLVLLHLGAGWCHWCHVMEEETYRNPAVVALLRERFVTVHADQDSRPDLASRYENYGWPATIVLNAQGRELALRRGYIPPDRMLALLKQLDAKREPIDDAAEPPLVIRGDAPRLSDEQRAEIIARQNKRFDQEQGSWGRPQKRLHWECAEFALRRGGEGDAEFEQQARLTLDQQLKLIDPVWGGVYQYSTRSSWDNPHFEKLMEYQTENLRIYGLAFAQTGEARYRDAGAAIVRYLGDFLRDPESGAFYTSQDADLVPGQHSAEFFALDDAGRRAQGIPRVDTHRYGRENGWAIRALAAWYGMTGDERALEWAIQAAEWALKERSIEGGGFRHDAQDPAGPYLNDALAMGVALLQLYEVTADTRWLERAREAASFIAARFKHPEAGAPGWLTAAPPATPSPAHPIPGRQIDENATAARWFNLLADYTGQEALREHADRAMRFLADPTSPDQRLCPAGILLADEELHAQALHITVVGPRDDPNARALFAQALKTPTTFRRVEWYDPARGPLPNPDTPFPKLERPAAFLCADGACSSPVRSPDELPQAIERFLGRGGPVDL